MSRLQCFTAPRRLVIFRSFEVDHREQRIYARTAGDGIFMDGFVFFFSGVKVLEGLIVR